ncbi:MAG: hypothetical protein ACPG5U_04545 [Planktomarina sp.]
MRRFVLSIVALTFVSGCSSISSSSLNPGNWFGGAEPAKAGAITEVPSIIPAGKSVQITTVEGRELMEQLASVEVRDVSGGVLVTAQGRTSRAGAYNLQLVNEGVNGTTLALAFRVQYPAQAAAGGSQLVTVAQFLSEKTLRGIRAIQVRGANGNITRQN